MIKFKIPINSMHHLKLIPTLTLILIIQSSFGQLALKYPGYEDKSFRSMRYGLFKPLNYDPAKSYPLIIYLHGSRDTVSRDLYWYQESVQREHPCFVLTPKCENPDQGWGNTWSAKHAEATAKTLALADSIVKRYNINTNRLYLYGISMGGFGVFSILQKEQGKFAAAYAICGGSDARAASQLTGTPLWIFHGAIDDVVPVHLSRDVYREIVRLGGKKVRYTEYPGVKHNSWENVSKEGSLRQWLFTQDKGKPGGPATPVKDFSAGTEKNAVTLNWKPGGTVWYYRLFRDSDPIAELDGAATSFTDPSPSSGIHTYSITAVNFHFRESAPARSQRVRTAE